MKTKKKKLGPRRPRFTGADPQTTLPCKWCEEVKLTTIEEVWCIADPSGHLVRLCPDCQKGCAAG